MDTKQIVCNGCLSHVPAGSPRCPYCGQSFANTNPAGTLPVNTVLMNRYTLGRVLALDGEGVTYAAADAQTSRRVVIKECVPVTMCASRTREGVVLPRREREVQFKTTRMDFVDLYRSLLSLGPSEGLVRVYDVFEANNTAYAVREPENGTTLLAYLQARRVPLTTAEALSLLRPVFAGVETLHRKGLLHRGISPETIYISADGRAKLSGYATTGLRTSDSQLKSQLFVGYAAPEQYAASEFDGQYTDVYGLGAVMYRAVTGKTPPPAERRRASDTLVAPRNIESSIAPFVSAALMRSLRMVGAERIQTVGDLLDALTTPQHHERRATLTTAQTRIIIIGVAALVVVAALIIWAIVAAGGKKAASSSVTSSTSAPASSSAASAATVTVPSFIGQKYTDVQTNSQYIQNFMFALEYEFSSEYGEGEIMGQTPASGTVVEPGTVVTLTVSRGAETVIMPNVVGQPRTAVKDLLNSMGIKYIILELENDGTYQEDYVAKTDTPEGTVLDPNKDQVVLYVAKAAPATTTAAPAATAAPETTTAPAA